MLVVVESPNDRLIQSNICSCILQTLNDCIQPFVTLLAYAVYCSWGSLNSILVLWLARVEHSKSVSLSYAFTAESTELIYNLRLAEERVQSLLVGPQFLSRTKGVDLYHKFVSGQNSVQESQP